MSNENTKAYAEDFCTKLKEFLKESRVNSFRSEFTFNIEDHSVTHPRTFCYSEKDGAELVVITKKSI